jgi:NAD+ diphosphatase
MSFRVHFNPSPDGPGWLLKLRANGEFVQVLPEVSGIESLLISCPGRDQYQTDFIHLGQWCDSPIWLQQDDNTVGESVNLRHLADRFSAAEFALCSRAMQLIHWRLSHRFCGSCGAGTELSNTELCCTCPSCGAMFYPRIAPCVIGLVSRGDELLLAAHQRHKPGRYSLLAGFIEAGETAEEAFAREVFEEVGVRISQIRYVASQPWPYPSQLMLGFFAEYQGGEITPDTNEIQHAAWFHPTQLPDIPSNTSIAGKLIRAFLAERGYPLKD